MSKTFMKYIYEVNTNKNTGILILLKTLTVKTIFLCNFKQFYSYNTFMGDVTFKIIL